LRPVYAPAARSFFVSYQRIVCLVRAVAEKAVEEHRSAFSTDDSEVERRWKKDWLKKGLKFHIKRAPVWLPADPARPAPVDAAEDV